jgi:VCBS repeat-containing protein
VNGTGQASAHKTITIDLADVNEAATDVTLEAVNPLKAGVTLSGIVVIQAAAIDPDVNTPAFLINQYRLLAGSSDLFTIDPASGEISVTRDVGAADVGDHTIIVEVFDGDLVRSVTRTVTVLAADNVAPSNVRLSDDTTAATVEENVTVIATVKADDDRASGELRYFIEDHPILGIDAVTGSIFVKPGAVLSYEAGNTYLIEVWAVDGNGFGEASVPTTITINVTDANEAATDILFTGRSSVAVGDDQNDPVVRAIALDPDLDISYQGNQYRFEDGQGPDGLVSADGLFVIDAGTGQISLARDVTADDLTNPAKVLKVVAHQGSLSKMVEYTVTVVANHDPVIDSIAASGDGVPGGGDHEGKIVVSELAGLGEIATVTASDPDADDTLTYQLANDHNGLFVIDANGVIGVNDAVRLAVDVDTEYRLTVTVSDGRGGSTMQTVVIRVTNSTGPNLEPDIQSIVASGGGEAGAGDHAGKILVSTGEAAGEIGTVTAVDPDATDTLSYALDGTYGELFAIDAGTGKITLADTDLLGAADTEYVLTVVASDGNGGVDRRTVTVRVTGSTEQNVAPTPPLLNGGTTVLVWENQAVVGDLNATDADNDPLTYRIIDDPGQMFVIVGNAIDGYRIRVAPGKNLNFEAATSHTVTVEVSDGRGGTAVQQFTINVDNQDPAQNNAPTGLTLTGGAIQENSPRGTVVGSLQGVDADPIDSLVYTLLQDDDGKFEIVGNELRLKAGAALNYEDKRFHDIVVRVTDLNGTGLSYDKAFRIHVGDVADPEDPHDPTGVLLSRNYVYENLGAGAQVGTLIGLDQDGGDTLTYAMEPGGDAGGRFTISSVDGVTRLVTSAVLDYEDPSIQTESIYGVEHRYFNVQVRVTDQTQRFKVETLKVYVNDIVNEGAVNNAPTNITIDNNTVREYATTTVLVGQLPEFDQDGDAVSYRLIDSAGGRFTLSGKEVRVDKGYLIDFEQKRDWQIIVEANDGRGGITEKKFDISVRNLGVELLTGTPFGDRLVGGSRNDRFTGGLGDDTLSGAGGNDTLDGGAGSDVFMFTTRPNATTNMDTVRNFDTGDRIQLTKSAVAFAALGALGELTEAEFEIGVVAQRATTRILYDDQSGKLYYDSNGSAAGGQAQFALLETKPVLNHTHFWVI